MATNAVNERDKLLDATVPRLIDPYGVEPLTVTGSTSLLRYVATPAAPTVLVPVSTISIFSTNTRGAEVSWSILGNPQGVSLQTNTGAATILTYTTGLTQDTVTVRASIVTPLYSPTSLTKDFILTKQVPSQTIKNLLVYRRGTAQPATPTGGTYVFSTGVVSAPSGWSVSIPTGTDPVYSSVCQVQSYNDQSSTAIPITQTWSLPTVAMQDGAPGDAVDIVFIRSATQPTIPTPSIGTPTGWESNVQALPSTPIGAPIWSSTGTKATGSINYVWNTPVQQSGTAIAELTIYKRQTAPPDPAPATPVGGSYNFSSKTLSPPIGWQSAFPSGTDPVYTSRAVVSTSVETASISVTQWSTPVLTVQDGAPGERGSIQATFTGYFSWNDTTVNNLLDINGYGIPMRFDSVTLRSTVVEPVFIQTKIYDGQGWILPGQIIDGNLIVKGTILADRISANGVLANGLSVTNIGGDTANSKNIFVNTNLSTGYTFLTPCSSIVTNTPNGTHTAGLVGKAIGAAFTNVGVMGNAEASAINNIGVIGVALGTTGERHGGAFAGTTQDILLGGSNRLKYSTDVIIGAQTGKLLFSLGSEISHVEFSNSGDILAKGNITAYGSLASFSDKTIKENISPISNATFKLKQINGYQYKNLLANKLDCGIIAQEVEKILPELVQVGLTEFEGTALKTVNYNGLVALLVASNRELISRVEALEKYIHDNANNRGNNSTTDTE